MNNCFLRLERKSQRNIIKIVVVCFCSDYQLTLKGELCFLFKC